MDKSDIMGMPEGMSSEELDRITTEGTDEDVTSDEDIDLAQEVIEEIDDSDDSAGEPDKEEAEETEEETEEPEEDEEGKETKPKVDPKDAVIGDFRRKVRDLAIEKARLEGRLEAMQEMGKKPDEQPVEQSPLNIAKQEYIEQYGNLDGFTMSVDLYEKQEDWKEQQAQKKTEQTNRSEVEKQANQLADTEYSEEKLGIGLDFRSIVIPGQRYLTQKHLQLISTTAQVEGQEAAIRKTYDLCKKALLEAGGPQAEAIKLAMSETTKPKPKPKPKPKGNNQTPQNKRKPMTSEELDQFTTEGDEFNNGESEQTHNQELVDFIFSPEQ